MGLGALLRPFKKITAVVALTTLFVATAAPDDVFAAKRKNAPGRKTQAGQKKAGRQKLGRYKQRASRPKGPPPPYVPTPDGGHILMKEDGTIILSKNMDEPFKVASVAKFFAYATFSAKLAQQSKADAKKILQENPNLSPVEAEKKARQAILLRKVTVTSADKAAVSRGRAGAPCLSARPGENEVTIQDLIELAMGISCNEAAYKYMVETFGSEEAAVRAINEFLKEIGLSEKTVMRNVTGLPGVNTWTKFDDGKFSTATPRDTAETWNHLRKYFPESFAVLSLEKVFNPITGGYSKNTNPLVWMNPSELGFMLDGSKTGTSSEAGTGFTADLKSGNASYSYVTFRNSSVTARTFNAIRDIRQGLGLPTDLDYIRSVMGLPVSKEAAISKISKPAPAH